MINKIFTTNCLIVKEYKILLGLKKRGFAEGRWNGFGGKVMEGETVEQAAVRELQEECGITPTSMELVGVLDFEYQGKDQVMEVNIFKITQYEGEPIETEEMKPQWFSVDQLPFDAMWPDDKYWFPLFLEGKKFKGRFIFEEYGRIISHELSVIDL